MRLLPRNEAPPTEIGINRYNALRKYAANRTDWGVHMDMRAGHWVSNRVVRGYFTPMKTHLSTLQIRSVASAWRHFIRQIDASEKVGSP